MKFKVVLVIYNRNARYTVAINRGWRSLWRWKLPLIYHEKKEEAEQDMAILLKETVFID